MVDYSILSLGMGFPVTPLFCRKWQSWGPWAPSGVGGGESLGQGLRKTSLFPQHCLQGTAEEGLLKMKFKKKKEGKIALKCLEGMPGAMEMWMCSFVL